MSGFLKTNQHNIERVFRVVAGAGLVGAAATGSIGVWGYVGLVLVVTGAIGTCPIYTLLGISTCPLTPAKN